LLKETPAPETQPKQTEEEKKPQPSNPSSTTQKEKEEDVDEVDVGGSEDKSSQDVKVTFVDNTNSGAPTTEQDKKKITC
jgi:type IV secretory pathway component VirB8